VTRRPDPGPPGRIWPYWLVIDDYLVEALQQVEPWRVVGDSLDWERAVFAYDVPADTIVMGVVIPAGLYTREVTGDGRHVIAHRWTDRAALIELLNSVDQRHYLFDHIAHAATRFVAAHHNAIQADAQRALASLEHDERVGGPLHDAPIRCWYDLAGYVDDRAYIEDAPRGPGAAAYQDDDFVTAVVDRTDSLLHERDRALSLNEAEAAGLDGTLRDGSVPPHLGQPHAAPTRRRRPRPERGGRTTPPEQ
jgi:hypothetical protein